MEYTKEQVRAITANPDKNALIVALAGAGKSVTIAWQVAYLIKHHGFAPSNILALTYSVRAAESLRDRITSTMRDKIGEHAYGVGEIAIDTMHAWAAKWLRDRVKRYSRYEIWDEAKRRLFVFANIEKLGIDRIPLLRGDTRHLTSSPRDLALFLEVVDRLRAERVPMDDRLGVELRDACRAYVYGLDRECAWDYPAILQSLDLAISDESDADRLALQKWLSDTIRLVIIDEAQDLSADMWAILDRLHSLGARLWRCS